MTTIRNYLLVAFGILIVLSFLDKLPYILFSGFGDKSIGQLKEVDLRDFNEIKKHVSQGYGSNAFALFAYIGGSHNGIDISVESGAPIHSPASGEIVATGNQDDFCYKRNYGKFLVLKTSDNYALLFAHLSKIKAGIGDKIEEGGIIGNVGVTGLATASHLHFTVFKKDSFLMGRRKDCGPNPEGQTMNPLGYLD